MTIEKIIGEKNNKTFAYLSRYVEKIPIELQVESCFEMGAVYGAHTSEIIGTVLYNIDKN